MDEFLTPHQVYKPSSLQGEITRLLQTGCAIDRNGHLHDIVGNEYTVDYYDGTITVN